MILKVLKLLIEEKINELFLESVLEEYKELFSEFYVIILIKEVELFLDGLKVYVIFFVLFSDVKFKKFFVKMKKLKIFVWFKLDLCDYIFYGWNDIV